MDVFDLKHFILIILIASLSPSYAFPLDKNSFDEYSRGNLIAFTRSLIDNHEYYRALHELTRIHSTDKNFLDPLEFFITKNYLLYKGGQYNAMLNDIKEPDNGITGLAGRLYAIDAFIGLMDYKRAQPLIESHTPGVDPGIDKFFFKRRLFSYVLYDRLDNKRELGELRQLPDFSKYHELVEGARTDLAGLKSPGLAALLGIIPGMGHVYAGNPGTGFTAFIVIAVNAAISYYGFSTGNKPLGLFVGAIGTFFYGGSILGGYLSAGNYNKSVLNNIHNGLVNDLKFNEDHDYLYQRYGIGKYGKQ